MDACSFFGDQEGDFELVINSIAAAKTPKQDVAADFSTPYRDDPMREQTMTSDEKAAPAPSRRGGWLGWLLGCIGS